MSIELSNIQNNLRKILEQITPNNLNHSPNQTSIKFNRQNNLQIKKIQQPNNPLNKKQFLKKSRAKSITDQQNNDFQKPLQQQCMIIMTQQSTESNSKNKRNLKSYIIDDITDKKIEANNHMFNQIINHLIKIRNKINQQLKTNLQEKFVNSASKRNISSTKNIDSRKQQLVLANIKAYFDQIFTISHNSQNQYAFPKQIQTIIEFQSMEEHGQHLEVQNYMNKQKLHESNISYFKKSLNNINNIGYKTTGNNSRKNSRNQQEWTSIQGCKSNSNEKILRSQINQSVKRESIYQKVLKQKSNKNKRQRTNYE